MANTRTKIFHITDLQNLCAIFRAGELRAKRLLEQNDTRYVNIAHQSIQDRRARTSVPCGPGGTLHDYVPFYFAARSPMLFTISKGNVDGYAGGQQAIVHLVSTAQVVAQAGRGFVFTDGHGIIRITEFFDDLKYLDEVDWTIMKSKYWADTDDDLDRKRRRQAEFLVYNTFPVGLICKIGVMNRWAKRETEALLARFSIEIPVQIKLDWYYS